MQCAITSQLFFRERLRGSCNLTTVFKNPTGHYRSFGNYRRNMATGTLKFIEK